MTYQKPTPNYDNADADADEASSLLTIVTASRAPSFSLGQGGGVPATKKKNGVPMRTMIATTCFFLGTLAVIYGRSNSSSSTASSLPLVAMIESPNGLVKSSDDYYSGIDASATGDVLRTQLQALISVKTTVSYDGVWKAFESVDKFLPGYPCSPDPEDIPDIYSSFCWKTEKVVPGGECGAYKGEGDCFNREHSWPKSWFGGFSKGDGAQTDLFELYPSDGYVIAM